MKTRALLRRAFVALPAAVCFGATASAATPGPVEALKPEPLTWDFERSAFSGPTLDPAWFSGKRAVVYLVPDDARPAARRAVAQVLRGCWSAGDFSLCHVFVSSTPGRAKFVAGRRIGLRDMAESLAEELGQDEEYVAMNEEHLSEEVVFFVHDPEAATWNDLLGHSADASPAPAIVLLDSGRVLRVIGIQTAVDGAGDAGEAAVASNEESAFEELDPAFDVRLHLPEPRTPDP